VYIVSHKNEREHCERQNNNNERLTASQPSSDLDQGGRGRSVLNQSDQRDFAESAERSQLIGAQTIILMKIISTKFKKYKRIVVYFND